MQLTALADKACDRTTIGRTQTPMKDRIERALAGLIGLPMWAASRAADMATFQFGERRRVRNRQGQAIEVGEYALHVQCAWRLVDASGIVVASRDYYYPAGDPDVEPPDFDHDQLGANRQDERMEAFFSHCGDEFPVVQRLEADRVGSLRIVMSHKTDLEVFPNDSLDWEHWRFFRPHSGERHFVVTGRGIEPNKA